MTWKDGEFDGQELAFRCWACGDSHKNPNKAHCSVNVFTSVYYCLRCNASGRLGSYEMSILTRGLKFDRSQQEIDLSFEPDLIIEAISQKLKSGPASSRYSALDRYHILTQDGKKLEIFKSVDASQTVFGYHIRPKDKSKIRTFGKRLLGIPSKIQYDKPWRVVEGPYDAIDPHCDVCVFGFPSQMQARSLYGKELILCPDGDVWEDYRKLRQFMKPFLWDNNIMVKFIERLPPGIDPDQCLPHHREQISLEEVKKILTPRRSFFLDQMKPEEILADLYADMPEEEFWPEYK